MNFFIKAAAISLTVVALAACGGDKDSKASGSSDAPTATSSSQSSKYTKADFMKSCKMGMTEAQCDCYVDFYKSIGLKITDLGDQDKVQAAMKSLKPKDAMKVAKCVQ